MALHDQQECQLYSPTKLVDVLSVKERFDVGGGGGGLCIISTCTWHAMDQLAMCDLCYSVSASYGC